MAYKQSVFVFTCQLGTLSIFTYLYFTGFFSSGHYADAAKYVDWFLTFGVLPMAWLVIAVQAWQVYKTREYHE
ncbi:hypothetical protein [Vibrio sp. 1180_3]|uniref:hypothetical protein n=1 Tax=Vibrio sp. 1180_3 TaxID=2528832 RepID=UPI002405FA7A|nr:hypothetical protein [Vibrio sp. 1180_3]MDF9399055.1 hypothetical protein [Vibrio sp. 1180_3]